MLEWKWAVLDKERGKSYTVPDKTICTGSPLRAERRTIVLDPRT